MIEPIQTTVREYIPSLKCRVFSFTVGTKEEQSLLCYFRATMLLSSSPTNTPCPFTMPLRERTSEWGWMGVRAVEKVQSPPSRRQRETGEKWAVTLGAADGGGPRRNGASLGEGEAWRPGGLAGVAACQRCHFDWEVRAAIWPENPGAAPATI